MREYKGEVIIEVMSATLSAVKIMPDMINYPSYTRIDSLFLSNNISTFENIELQCNIVFVDSR